MSTPENLSVEDLKELGQGVKNIDFMTFINSLQNASAMHTSKKKSKKPSKCTIKEVDNEDEYETEEDGVNKDACCDDDNDVIEDDEDDDKDDDEDDDEDDDDEDDEDDDDDDDNDDNDDDDDDDDDDDETHHARPSLTEEGLWNVLNNFLTDEEGNNVATSLSNIAYELHKINKYLKSK